MCIRDRITTSQCNRADNYWMEKSTTMMRMQILTKHATTHRLTTRVLSFTGQLRGISNVSTSRLGGLLTQNKTCQGAPDRIKLSGVDERIDAEVDV